MSVVEVNNLVTDQYYLNIWFQYINISLKYIYINQISSINLFITIFFFSSHFILFTLPHSFLTSKMLQNTFKFPHHSSLQTFNYTLNSQQSFYFANKKSFNFSTSKKQNHQSNRSSELSPSQQLKSKFARFNNDLLLPRCLQKTLKKKFTLSPLAQRQQKSQSAFKLKNYFKMPYNNFDAPKQIDEKQSKLSKYHRKCNDLSMNQMRLIFLKENIDQQNKQNLPYQNQLAQMLITQSKMKYSPRDTLRNTKIKWRNLSNLQNQPIQQVEYKNNNSILSKTSSLMNFGPQRKTQYSQKDSKQLLNSTRTKLLCKIDKIPFQKITKTDLFPLEKLLQKRIKKTNFRNKWFNTKKIENHISTQ